MKISTQEKSRFDVLQYAMDDVFAVKTLSLTTALTAALKSGDCIDATGAKVTNSSTVCYVVADYTAANSKSVVVFDKMVCLISAQLVGADAAGTTKALALLAANQFIRLV